MPVRNNARGIEEKATSTQRLRFCRAPRGEVRFPRRVAWAAASINKDDIRLLYEYDRWANNRVLQAASALTAEQFTRDLGGSFRSVRDTLVHIIGGEWGWLAYWKEPSHNSDFLTDLRTRRDALFNPDAFPNVAAVHSKWAEVEKEQAEFVNRLTNESLGKMVPFRQGFVCQAIYELGLFFFDFRPL